MKDAQRRSKATSMVVGIYDILKGILGAFAFYFLVLTHFITWSPIFHVSPAGTTIACKKAKSSPTGTGTSTVHTDTQTWTRASMLPHLERPQLSSFSHYTLLYDMCLRWRLPKNFDSSGSSKPDFMRHCDRVADKLILTELSEKRQERGTICGDQLGANVDYTSSADLVSVVCFVMTGNPVHVLTP